MTPRHPPRWPHITAYALVAFEKQDRRLGRLFRGRDARRSVRRTAEVRGDAGGRTWLSSSDSGLPTPGWPWCPLGLGWSCEVGMADACARRPRSARATTAATRSRPSCSTSTTSATPTSSATASVPRRAGGQGAPGRGQLPRVRHRDRRREAMSSASPAGHRLGHRLRPHRSGLGRRPVPDLGRAARQRARSPTPTATAAPGCRCATRTSPPIAYDTEHFTSRSVVVSEVRPGRRTTSRRRSAWRRRSRPTRRSTPWPAGCCCPRSRPRRSRRSSRSPATLCRELLDARGRRRPSSTPPSTTPSTSRCA